MSGSFYNEKARTSWILSQYSRDNQHFTELQSTPFASSSLAAAANNYLAMDYGSQVFGLEKGSTGIQGANIDIYSTDKSSLGLEWSKRSVARGVHMQNVRPKVTVPNIYSLRRSTLL